MAITVLNPSGSDDRGKIQDELNLGNDVVLEPGTYNIDGPLYIPDQFQSLRGQDKRRVVLKFSMPASGVWPSHPANVHNAAKALINLDKSYQAISDLTISCNHNTGASHLGALFNFPWAIHGNKGLRNAADTEWLVFPSTGIELKNLEIQKANYGIQLENAGKSRLEDIDFCAFYTGIEIRNAIDSVYLTRCRMWGFGLNEPADDIYTLYHGTTSPNGMSPAPKLAFNIGYVDDFHMTDCGSFEGRVKIFEEEGKPNNTKGPSGSVTGLILDGDNAVLELDGGELHIHGMYGSRTDLPGQVWVAQTKGDNTITGFHFAGGQKEGVYMVQHTGGSLRMAHGRMELPGQLPNGTRDAGAVFSGKPTGGARPELISLHDIQFFSGSGDRSRPIVRVADSLLSMTACRAIQKSESAAGEFLSVSGSSDKHIVVGNVSGGYAYNVPGGFSTGSVYANNI